MQTQIHDASSLRGGGSYTDGLKTILDAIAATDALQTAQETAEAVKPCGCPPGVCLGGSVQGGDVFSLDGLYPPEKDASADEHAAFGQRLAARLAETLPRGPNGEAPTVVFDGAFANGVRLDEPAGEPVTGEPVQADTRVFEPYPNAFGDMPDASDFEKRTVVAQLVRGIENIGAAAAIAARLVEETYEA